MKTKGNLISLISVIFILLVGMAMTGCATPLHEAAGRGNINEVRRLIEQGADINANSSVIPSWSHDRVFGTPLHHAAYYGRVDIVKLLIEKGADVNPPSGGEKSTPLHYAVLNGHANVVTLLIEKGADVNAKDVYGNTPFEQETGNRNKKGYKSEARIESAKGKGNTDRSKILSEAEKKFSEGNEASAVAYTPKPAAKETANIDIHTIPDFKAVPRPDDIAVIIGIENYQGLPKSDFSKSDAGIVKDYLKALGFQERNIELLIDERATFSGITKTIEAWLPNRVKKESKVFVYYSGHGAPEPKTGDAYLVPYDGDPNYLEVTGYPLKRLYDKLGKLQVEEVVVLLDSCFSGAGGRSVLAKGARPLVMMADVSVLSSNMAVLSATQGTQISSSSPEKGHGIFTYYFLKALKEGKKTIAEIYEYIKPLVEDEAKQLNVQQSPSINPDVEKLKGRFGLRR